MSEHLLSFKDMEPLIKEKLTDGGSVEIKVIGTSMSPFYVDKLTYVSISKPQFPLRPFQVILFKRGEVAVLHRIVKVKEQAYLVMGDAQNQMETVKQDQIVGVVTSHRYLDKVTEETNRWYLFKVWWWHQHRFFRKLLLRGWHFFWKLKNKSSSK